ncbi:DUF2267 domain-containing protein [Dactylosporangium sp. CA-139066]|uniref:DUF2267 domain-containing protein n=1 Tax=Dactylosporangium sp. CA-139066 TaxID=3239930 RepID=UPI003D93745F
MNYDSFLEIVRQEAGIEPEQAENISCSTLNLLAQRISKGEAEDLARRLPEPLRPCMEHGGPRATFHADALLQRIERELHSDHATAERVARAVLTAVYVSVGSKEYADMRSELPKDFLPLLESAEATAVRLRTRPSPPFVGGLGVDEFVGRVAERAGLTQDLARKATEAVLEVLAMRVTDGQIEDLKPFVPRELHDPLNLGEQRSGGRALPLSVEQFLDEIARREGEGVTREQAAQHARAVFAVLHEAVGEKEFRDTVAQLPLDYISLVEAARTGTGVDVGRAPGGTVAATGAPSQPPEFIGPLSADEFVGRVAERAHLDPGRAARATDAVLEALALRITAGEVEDLRPFIPPELRGPLDRGVERSRGRARRMELQHFLDEIATHEGPGVTEEEAASHARAVFAVLYEVVGEKEFRDTIAQLPAEYERILPQVTKPRR